MPNWTIVLSGDANETTLTGPDGYYCFDQLEPGNYQISEVPQTNWNQTYPVSPGIHTITLTEGQSDNDINFGNHFFLSVCPVPNWLTALNISAHQATVAWDQVDGVISWDIEYGPSPFIPTGTPTISNVTNPYTLTGLTPSTAYTFLCKSQLRRWFI